MTVPDGSFVVLLGPTGAGKTTTLRLISGLERPDTRRYPDRRAISPGRNAGATRCRHGVPAIFALSAHDGARQSGVSAALADPQDARGRDQAQGGRGRGSAAHFRTSSTTRRPRFPAARCSGCPSAGRWCAIPSIYLMDEPLSSLDAKLRADLRVELKSIQANLGATFLYVTHDQIEAMTMATHIGVLDRGRLVQFGSPRDIYENPVSLYVAGRLGIPRHQHPSGGCLWRRTSRCSDDWPASRTHIARRGQARQCDPGRTSGRPDPAAPEPAKAMTSSPLTDVHTGLEPGDHVAIQPHNPLFFDASGARIA